LRRSMAVCSALRVPLPGSWNQPNVVSLSCVPV
jgi:hypothetical protein